MVEPTTIEIKMQPEDMIVSKTDVKGRITYCNDSFMEFSGYNEEEVLGQPHNMIRHPDMPRAVFRQMWHTLQAEDEFFGFVKNMHKDGSFYWTFANVTPSFNSDNQLLGYFSVRRYPHPDAIEFFEPLYQQMCELESQYSGSQEAMDESDKMLEQVVTAEGGYDAFICSYYK